jgi:hypothetical protein
LEFLHALEQDLRHNKSAPAFDLTMVRCLYRQEELQMDALNAILPLLEAFASCFTRPGAGHFATFVAAHMALMGVPHCVTEVMRLTGVHERMHWTTPYTFLKRTVWCPWEVSKCLLSVIVMKLGISGEVVVAVDDTLVKKWGTKFFGLGYYPDPTDKNPGGSQRRVRGHCWVVLALLWRKDDGQWFCFPLSALLFVPEAVCEKARRKFRTKIELACMLVKRLCGLFQRVVVVVDNLYAKGKLATLKLEASTGVLVSRLRSNAALYEKPGKRPNGKRGRKPIRGEKASARQLFRRKSKRRTLRPSIYGSTVTIEAFVDVLIPSRTLGNFPILLVIFPQRSGKRMNVFFSTDIQMDPTHLLELYAARFKIEDTFDELKTVGGFGDYRTRSHRSMHRHVTLTLVAYSLLRLVSVTLPQASDIETEPWWSPAGPPSVTRLRRAVAKALRISIGFPSDRKAEEIPDQKHAA